MQAARADDELLLDVTADYARSATSPIGWRLR